MGVIGTVEAFSTVTVRAQITGELTSVKFQQGDDVAAGQELFTLDRRPLEAALQQARGQSPARHRPGRNATAILERYEQLVQRGILAREQRDTARATVAALEGTLAADRAAVENAKVQLQYATIRAPIQGRTGALMVTAGNLVRANDQTPLVTINQVSPIFVSFAFPEALAAGAAPLYRSRIAARRGPSDRQRGAGRRRHHHLRRQRRRPDDRHDQGQGDVRQREPRAVAGAVRQRRGPARHRVGGDRRAVGCRPDRARGQLRLRRHSRTRPWRCGRSPWRASPAPRR